MGLFGALFAGVSGLDSQSNKIGIISNNIANVNTVGYKQGQAAFDTLVVQSGTSSFSPGGVIGSTQDLVNQQGIISATTSATDVAISGSGLLVVNTEADGSGQTLYTRAGSFTQDSNGNFVNSDGYYLEGLPIEADGTTEQANPQNLKTVSISQSATGAATATSLITLAANLNSSQTVLQGPGETTGISNADTTNYQNTGTQILLPTTGTGLTVGNAFTVTSTGSNGTTTSTYTYGGFTYGRSVNVTPAAATGTELGSIANNPLDTETDQTITTSAAHPTQVTVSVANGADYVAGQYGSISGVTTTIDGLTPADLNGEWKILSSTANTVTFQIAASATNGGVTGPATTTVSNRTYPFTGNILNATNTSDDFLQNISGGTASFAPDALEFQITSNGVTSTFTYNSVPNTTEGQFNSLLTLQEAISNTSGLTASLSSSGQLYVSSTDANQGVTFANVDAAGNASATPPTAGINWVQELGLGPVAANTSTTTHLFNSLSGLSTQINTVDPADLVSSVANPNSSTPTISIHENNPLQTITISDATTNNTTNGSLIAELGMKSANNNSLTQLPGGGSTSILTTGTLPATYSPSDNTRNMSSGAVTPQYSKDITVYDAQGTSHTLALNFVKLNTNVWAVEATAVPASDINPSTSDGQVASGTLTFGSDGDLVSATGTIAATNGFTINWTNGAGSSTITMNLGVDSGTGLIQTAAAFNVSTAQQNGSPVGELSGVSIDSNGYVIASFSNGQTQKIFQVPLASVNNPDGLESVSGNAYIQTVASGIPNLQIAGTSGVGTFTSSALEQSNVDLSTQLTNLIVAQQAYGANSKVLTVADTLLQELDQIIQ